MINCKTAGYQHSAMLRKARIGVMALAAVITTHGAALAEWKPTQTVEVIISSNPGGGQDRTGRGIAAVIPELTGVNATALNKPGGGGTVAWTYLNAHEGDGHYLAISSGRLLTSYIEGVTQIGYPDITPLAQVLTEYAFFSVKADSDIKDADDLAARLKADPQSLSIYNGGGLGSPSHIAVAQMAKAAGVDPMALKLVSFDSGGEAMAALLGGHIDVHTATGTSVVPRLREGVIRVIGVAAPERLESLPDVPTWKEQGYDFVAERSTTVFGPKGLSADQIAYWDSFLAEMVKTDTWKDSAAKSFRENTYLNAAQTAEYLEKRHNELKEIMTELDLIQK